MLNKQCEIDCMGKSYFSVENFFVDLTQNYCIIGFRF